MAGINDDELLGARRWYYAKVLRKKATFSALDVAQAGAWKYAFVYDLVHRFYPDLPDQPHNMPNLGGG